MVAANGIYRLSVVGTVAGQQHVHTLHFRSTVATSVAGLTEEQYMNVLVDGWRSNAGTQYRACFHNTTLPVQTIQVRKVCGSVPLPVGYDESEPGASQAGTQGGLAGWGGDALAPWLASVTTLRTGNAGRSYRGRSFIGGLHEEGVTGATIQSNVITALTAYFQALKDEYATTGEVADAAWFVFSRVLANGKPADPTATPPKPAVPPVACQLAGADVRTFVVRNTLATMKSRKAGSGL